MLAVAAVVLPLASAGLRGSLGLVLAAVAAVAVLMVGAWWFLTHRGLARVLAGLLLVAAPIVLLVAFVRAGLLWVVVVDAALWAASVAASRASFDELAADQAPREYPTPAPRHPFLIMNPRSGGGKVGRFDLVRRARELGAEVALLDGPGIDVVELARTAVAGGADLLGVAGGDGTQALVAGVAAEHDVPFMVLSAGTRNHFALDLGLDRENPADGLEALTDGVELHIDLGSIDGRTFVNNASFGAYAAVVQSPAYRDDKVRTTLDLLPDLPHATRRRRPQRRGGGRAPDGAPGRSGQQQPVRLRGRDGAGRAAGPPRRGRPGPALGHGGGPHGRRRPRARSQVESRPPHDLHRGRRRQRRARAAGRRRRRGAAAGDAGALLGAPRGAARTGAPRPSRGAGEPAPSRVDGRGPPGDVDLPVDRVIEWGGDHVTAGAGDPPVVIAHLSDLHFGRHDSAATEALLDDVAATGRASPW